MRSLRYCVFVGLIAAALAGLVACGSSDSTEMVSSASASDPPPAMEPSGPSDDLVKRALIGQTVLAERNHGTFDVERVDYIQRGTLMEANGNGGIPAGTTLYPIEATLYGEGKKMTYRFVFYQDPFGKWDFQEM